jgi:hypothetical protein
MGSGLRKTKCSKAAVAVVHLVYGTFELLFGRYLV